MLGIISSCNVRVWFLGTSVKKIEDTNIDNADKLCHQKKDTL